MKVDLDTDIAQLFERKVHQGSFGSASEVVREALHLLEERERLVKLRAALADADAQIDRGEYVEWTPTLLEELSDEADEMAVQGMKPHPDVIP